MNSLLSTHRFLAHRHLGRTLAFGAIVAACSVVSSQAALLTFGTLNNGVNTVNDPEAAFFNPVPAEYQPLNTTYTPTAGSAQDGFNIGVTITWNNVLAANGGAYDHTGDTPKGVIFNTGGNTFSLSFNKPVAIPSFYFGLGADPGATATFNVYSDAAGTNLLRSSTVTYTAGTQYAPVLTTVTAGLNNIQDIVFISNSNLTVDDITAVPEPSTAIATAFGGLALLGVIIRRHRKVLSRA